MPTPKCPRCGHNAENIHKRGFRFGDQNALRMWEADNLALQFRDPKKCVWVCGHCSIGKQYEDLRKKYPDRLRVSYYDEIIPMTVLLWPLGAWHVS